MRNAVIAATALVTVAWSLPAAARGDEAVHRARVNQVAGTKGLVAFWDFDRKADGTWTSYHDDAVVRRGYPVFLRRIGDPKAYTPDDWPYDDGRSRLKLDASGPFGRAVCFDQGYVFAEVPRSELDGTPLDICARRPFTLIAWARFQGKRHLVAGIWDEGGWNKYRGRRQVALFGGLFGSKGAIGHISATGAASYPQSTAPGSQYARCRAIDGAAFDNGEWVAMAMTFDPDTSAVRMYLNGVATPTKITDPVARSVFRYEEPVASNPYHFPWPIFSPRALVLKFNGYDVSSSGVYEHWLRVDLEEHRVAYGRSCPESATVDGEYRVRFDLLREGKSLLPAPAVFAARDGRGIELPDSLEARPGDQIVTSLEVRRGGAWRRVGTEIGYPIRSGAPFTFGRALGLGDDPIDHGSQLAIDGVAVFNRVLRAEELRGLSFIAPAPGK